MEAGFHVVCDKPLVHTSATGQRAGRGGARRRHGVRRHLQLHRLSDGAAGARDGAARANSARSARWSWNTTRAGWPRGWKPTATSRPHGAPTRRKAAAPARSATSARTPRTCCRTVTGLRGGEPLRRPQRLRARAHAGRRCQRAAAPVRRRARRARRVTDQHRRRERLAPARFRHAGHAGVVAGRAEPPAAQSRWTGPRALLTRGSPWLCEAARRASRLPPGHPEGFIEAFANVYLGVAEAIRAHGSGRAADPLAADYPDVAARRAWRALHRGGAGVGGERSEVDAAGPMTVGLARAPTLAA